jgi:hypothetical protein
MQFHYDIGTVFFFYLTFALHHFVPVPLGGEQLELDREVVRVVEGEDLFVGARLVHYEIDSVGEDENRQFFCGAGIV